MLTPFRITGFSPQIQIIDWYTMVFDNILQGHLMLYGLLVLSLITNIYSINYFGHAIAYNQYDLIGILAFFMTAQMSQALYRATVDKQYVLLRHDVTFGSIHFRILVFVRYFIKC